MSYMWLRKKQTESRHKDWGTFDIVLSLQAFWQYCVPFRKKGKTWDTETDSGFLWIWTGRFKRWKHTAFTCQQPGLLTYTGRQKRGKIARGGSINLHGAVVEPSPGNTRMFTVRTQEGKKAYLRCTDPADRELCIQSIRVSA